DSKTQTNGTSCFLGKSLLANHYHRSTRILFSAGTECKFPAKFPFN
ncbi:MAG: hypothetical protein ACI9G1_001368, partial [Pirellulaceae bacterium]